MSNNYGKVATIEATVQQGQPAAYVWKLWDGETRVTRYGVIQKALNRPTADFTVVVVDAYGQQFSLSGSAACILPPVVRGGLFGASNPILPYTISLLAYADSPAGSAITVQWLDESGTPISNSNPFAYTVTSPTEKLYLKVYESSNATSLVQLDFTLYGKQNTPPKVSQVSSGMSPILWRTVIPPVAAATTSQVTLVGLQTVDGYAALEGSRVCVKDQANRAENAIYIASTGLWQRSQDVIDIGTTVRTLHGTVNAGRYFAVAADLDPDAVIPGTTPIDFVRADVSYDGTVGNDAAVAFEVSVFEEDSQQSYYTASVIGAGSAGLLDADQAYVIRMLKDLTNQTPGVKEVSVSVQDLAVEPTQTISRLNPLLT
jgi:hypothetical protein